MIYQIAINFDKFTTVIYLILKSFILESKFEIQPRIHHICALINKEDSQEDDKLLFHGGEYKNQILSNYTLFNLRTQTWIQTLPKPKNLLPNVPQLKSHACCHYSVVDKIERNEKKGNNEKQINKVSYVIITGGLTIDHNTKCNVNIIGKCACDSLKLNKQIYIYYRESFTPIIIEDDSQENTTDYSPLLARYGHSMFNLNEKIYIICGFIQYIGFVIDIIELKINIKNTITCSCKKLEIQNMSEKFKGRIYSSVSTIFNKIVIFGGVKDNKTLNDMWIIDFENEKNLVLTEVIINTDLILPRFGMSTCIIHDSLNTNKARIMIFGGSYFNDENFKEGVTNELLVLNLQVII